MRIDKKIRDMAIHILSCCASTPGLCIMDLDPHWQDGSPSAETTRQAVELASRAVWSMTDTPERFAEIFAEAECMLREGWTP